MSNSGTKWLVAGAVLAGLGVAAGAFGAHGLEGRIAADLLAVFETGSRYHVIHAIALMVVGLVGRIEGAAGRDADGALELAGWMFTAGIVVFAGSLYALALTGERWLGAITPVGGACFLAGWTAMGAGALRTGRAGRPRRHGNGTRRPDPTDAEA